MQPSAILRTVAVAVLATWTPGAVSGFTFPASQLGQDVSPPEPAAPAVVVDRSVSEPGYPYPLVEPHLSISVVDPDHRLVVASAIERVRWREAFATSCVAYATRDAGASWQRSDFPVIECGDPWSAIQRDGTAWFLALGEVDEVSGLVAYRSPDGGFHWEEPIVVRGAFDLSLIHI